MKIKFNLLLLSIGMFAAACIAEARVTGYAAQDDVGLDVAIQKSMFDAITVTALEDGGFHVIKMQDAILVSFCPEIKSPAIPTTDVKSQRMERNYRSGNNTEEPKITCSDLLPDIRRLS